MKCSTNLQKHLKILKQEQNRIISTHLNGKQVDKAELKQHLEHRAYVRTLLHAEKLQAFDKMLHQR